MTPREELIKRREQQKKMMKVAADHLKKGKSHEDIAFLLTVGENSVDRATAIMLVDSVVETQETMERIELCRTDPIAAAKAGKPFAMTDLGNAERLVAYHGNNIKFDTARQCWRVWDGKRWDSDSIMRLAALAADTARKIQEEAMSAPAPKGNSPDYRAKLFQHALKTESQSRLSAMIEVAKSQPNIAVPPHAWDNNPWDFNAANGTINLRTGELRKHKREDLYTKVSKVSYDPDVRCAKWNRFLDDACNGDTDMMAFIQRAAGYTLTGDTSEEVIFFVHGPQAACKSTFLEALRTVCGDYSRTIQAELLLKKQSRAIGAASPELAVLAGARLAAGSEIEQGAKLAEALVKNITGGEAITARHLFAECFDFVPAFKLWLAMNHAPRVSADDGAIWRRIIRLPFEHTIPPDQRDPALKAHFKDPEAGGRAVLAWAVRGCIAWQDNGLAVPECIKDAIFAYREDSDPLAEFFAEHIEFGPGEWWTQWADIWQTYSDYADSENIAEKFRTSAKKIKDRLLARGCCRKKRHMGHGFTGLRIIATL